MNTFTYININTPSNTIFSDKFIDDYIVCEDVLDEKGNQVNIINFDDIETEAISKDNPEQLLQEIN